MSEKEKLLLLSDILINHRDLFGSVLESDLNDYRECIEIFLGSNDSIIREGALATCQLIIERIKLSDI